MTASDWPDGLREAFGEYERALMADDLVALDALFVDSERTVRGDPGGLLVGHAQIAAFRQARGGAPRRVLGKPLVTGTGPDSALVVVETMAAAGGTGLQTQLWSRAAGRWQVAAAHVSPPPRTFDATVWREAGDPLEPATGPGPLRGESVAVKDLFAVEGHRTEAGVPAYLDGSARAGRDADAVARLRAAGATIRGLARTDQFAYSIAGDNDHHGTPVNAVVAGGLPGGSTSGSATAVALGAASVGLGTDTAGSIRVPASYQGLWALRTTHGAVPMAGVVPLAPDFDTVGVLTRRADLLGRAAQVLLAGAPRTSPTARLLVDLRLGSQVDSGIGDAFSAATDVLGVEQVDLGEPGDRFEAFRQHQAFQAWQVHGAWITAHPGAVIGAAGDRFQAASRISQAQDLAARLRLSELRSAMDELLGDAVLLLPSASSPAPRLTAPAADVDRIRRQTLSLTCLAGLTGRPAVSAPLLAVPGGPLGLCLVGPRGSDLALIDLAADLARLLGRAV